MGRPMETNMSTARFFAILILLLPAVLIMSGCVDAGRYAAAAEQATKDAKNVEAAVLEDAPCLIGLGAWSRMPDPRKRGGVFYLCVPDADNYGVSLK